ncbi:uncharacterized protein B0H18DRAFT_1016896, partial [Fomitopsis serialis]|uniref:uncharacterized protein n=1 Tax=Fomitopsis serialis TaxID=139415 RepID=UPI002008DC8F
APAASPPRSNAPSVPSSTASSTLSVATNNTTTPSTPASTSRRSGFFSRFTGGLTASASLSLSSSMTSLSLETCVHAERGSVDELYWVTLDDHLTSLRKSAGNDAKKLARVFRSILDNDRASHGNNPAAINAVPEDEVVDERQQQVNKAFVSSTERDDAQPSPSGSPA